MLKRKLRRLWTLFKKKTSMLVNNPLDQSIISFINSNSEDFAERQVNAMKFRRYLKRASNLETHPLQSALKQKRQSDTDLSSSEVEKNEPSNHPGQSTSN